MWVWEMVQAVHCDSDGHPNSPIPTYMDNRQTVMSVWLIYIFLNKTNSQTVFLVPCVLRWTVQHVCRLHHCHCFLWLVLNFCILCKALKWQHTLVYGSVFKSNISMKWTRFTWKTTSTTVSFPGYGVYSLLVSSGASSMSSWKLDITKRANKLARLLVALSGTSSQQTERIHITKKKTWRALNVFCYCKLKQRTVAPLLPAICLIKCNSSFYLVWFLLVLFDELLLPILQQNFHFIVAIHGRSTLKCRYFTWYS